jgi:hypothetical protein
VDRAPTPWRGLVAHTHSPWHEFVAAFASWSICSRDALRMLLASLLLVAGPSLSAATGPDPERVRDLLGGDTMFFQDVLKLLDDETVKKIAKEPRAALIDASSDAEPAASDKSSKRHELLKKLSLQELTELSAPAGTVLIDRIASCRGKRPRIHHIGWKPVLTRA